MTSSVSIQSVATGSAYLGAALGVVMVVPQIARTMRDRHRPGVSGLTWALTALSCFTWLLYGVRADEFPQIPGNVLLVSGAIVVALAVPAPIRTSARALLMFAALAGLVGLAVVLPPMAVGFVGLSLGLVSAVPQIVRLVTHPVDGPSAVSVSAWVLRGASQVAWLFFAVVHGDLVVTISAIVLLTSAVIVVGIERQRRPSELLVDCVPAY